MMGVPKGNIEARVLLQNTVQEHVITSTVAALSAL